MTFNNVPGFACITEDQLETFLPKAGRFLVLDGPVIYGYKTRISEESGVLVTLTFARECVGAVEIEEDERYSKKTERVSKEFEGCLKTKHVDSSDPRCGGGIPEIMNRE